MLAVTGGTGFVGRILITMAVAKGWQVRALARSPQPPQNGVIWVPGALDQPESRAALMDGADAVIHLAGAVNAPNRAAFVAANVKGTAAMIDAARAAGVKRFIHVSSLAARLPDVSHYGWSKAKAELIVAASALNWTIIRPPWVFGPGDRDTLELFKAAQRGLVPLPRIGSVSVVHVADLARLLLGVVPADETHAQLYEPDDGSDDWTNASFVQAIGEAFAKHVRVMHLPKPLLLLGAHSDRMLRGSAARLSVDRVHYMTHPDWRVDPTRRPPPKLWVPQIGTRSALKTTLAAYREAKWIS